MAETVQTTTQETAPVMPNPFDESTWMAAPAEAETIIAEQKPEEKPAEEVKPAVVEEIKVETTTQPDYLKDLGFTSIDEAKTELEKLRSNAQTKEELKFANEQSKKLFDYIREGKTEEVYSILDTQRKLSQTEKLKAADAIRLHLELTNPHFKAEDVQDVFEERYALPEKPVQEIDEEDADFQARTERYNQNVAKVQRKIERDAVQAKTELARLQSELVLPDIEKPTNVDPNAAAAEAKRIADMNAARETYVKTLDADFNLFDGYKVMYKDEEVEVPVAYTVTDQEKAALRDELREFDLEAFVSGRWFNQGKPNVKQIMEDIHLLRNKEAILQKVANESGSKRLAEHLKKQSNINLNETKTPSGTFVAGDEKTEQQKLGEWAFSV